MFRFPHGEIDFIVSMSLLGLPNEVSTDCAFALEPVAEVLAKKLFYRGWALTPRDLFDWRLIETKLSPDEVHAPEIANLVSGRIDEIHAALMAMDMSVKAQLVWEGIRTPDLPNFHESILWAQNRLLEFRQMTLPLELKQVAENSVSEKLLLTAAQWVAGEAAKPLAAAGLVDPKVRFRVLHVAVDGVVVDCGRSVAVYPVSDGGRVRVGDIVAVGLDGALALVPSISKGGVGVG